MNIPRLRMESQLAQVSIQQQMANLEITQPKARMHIEQSNADFSIRTTKGKLTIDQSQAWEETNIKNTRKWIEDFARDGIEAVKSGMARRAQQGAALLDIHEPGNVISEQAVINGQKAVKNLSITYIPSPFSVKVSYSPVEVHIDAKAQQPIIKTVVNQPEIIAQRGGVNVQMGKHATLHMEVDPPITHI